MNKTYCIILLALCILALPARAQGVAQAPEGIGVDSLRLERNGKYLTVAMNLDLGGLEVKGDRAVLFTPVLHGSTDSVELKSVAQKLLPLRPPHQEEHDYRPPGTVLQGFADP